MDIEQKKLQDALNKISEYLEQHIDESAFRTMVVPVMIKSIESLNSQLSSIEKNSMMVAKQYWKNNSCNSSDLARARKQLIKYKQSIDSSKLSAEYFRAEAILKILYTFDDWEDEADNSLAYFGSNLLEAGVDLDSFYEELQAIFGNILD